MNYLRLTFKTVTLGLGPFLYTNFVEKVYIYILYIQF